MAARNVLIWASLAAVIAAPIALAAASPQLAWRDPLYIAASFAGIVAMALVLLQPLLAGGYLPGLPAPRGRRVHRLIGAALVAMIVAHVGGLWIASPPDVIDALLFNSPTPFSAWGVVGMWATFAAGLLAALRGPLRLSPRAWRIAHTALVAVIVVCGVVHALLIEGAMETTSKAVLCLLAFAATAKVLADLRAWALVRRQRR